jgi:hypothetical protein
MYMYTFVYFDKVEKKKNLSLPNNVVSKRHQQIYKVQEIYILYYIFI